jgi:hypothetical protein
MTGTIIKNMPNDSHIYVYGALGGANINNISVVDIIYRRISVQGLFLPNWLK